MDDLKSSVNIYFGSTNRIASGERFRVKARRTSPSGRVQYLIEWDGPSQGMTWVLVFKICAGDTVYLSGCVSYPLFGILVCPIKTIKRFGPAYNVLICGMVSNDGFYLNHSIRWTYWEILLRLQELLLLVLRTVCLIIAFYLKYRILLKWYCKIFEYLYIFS